MKARRLLLFFALAAPPAEAGRPFQTNDPTVTPCGGFELYLSGHVTSTPVAVSTEAPDLQLQWGACHNLQLTVTAGASGRFQTGGQNEFGFGDMTAGVKYRFINETPRRPQIAFYPVLEFPTGRASRGVGPGQLVATLPIYLQKSFGPWTVYGGGGAVVNESAGQRTYGFGGSVIERKVSKKLTLGGEIYGQGGEGPGSTSPQHSVMLDAGGTYSLSSGFSLLLAAGHSIAGQSETYAYLGLRWKWGLQP
jgi:hypothetical protein